MTGLIEGDENRLLLPCADKDGLAMAMERNVPSLITISLFDEPVEKDRNILGFIKRRKIGISKEKIKP